MLFQHFFYRKTWLVWLILFSIALSACLPRDTVPPGVIQDTPAGPAAPTFTLTSPVEITETVVSPEATLPPSAPTVTATPAPTRIPIVGVEMHSISPQGGLDKVREAGVYWVRRNALIWADVEPQEGIRNWEAAAGLEQELQLAAEQGFEVILIVHKTPAWARQLPALSCGPVREDKLETYASFIKDAVARYSVPPFNVKFWELGNEPDIGREFAGPDMVFGCWGESGDAYYGGEYYSELLKASYPQMKAADPQAQVMVGGLLLDCDPINPPEEPAGSGKLKNCTPALFLEGVLKNGGGDYFDGVSFHAYDYYAGELGKYQNPNWHSSWDSTGPGLIEKTRYLRELLASYGHPEKFLINTEGALICGRDGTEAPCQTDEFALTKAYYIPQLYASTLASGLDATVWYSLFGWRGSQLLNAIDAPLPGYEAFKFAGTQFQNATSAVQVNQFPGVKGYEVTRGEQRLWILWSGDGDTHTVRLPSTPAAVYNVFGGVLPAGQEVEINLAPVYIELAP